MLGAGREPEGIVHERGAVRHDAHRALGNAPELYDPLGDQIDVVLDVLVDLVEQFVQRDEGRALHVPVGLLALRLQVDALGEPLIEEPHRLAPAGLRQIVLRGE